MVAESTSFGIPALPCPHCVTLSSFTKCVCVFSGNSDFLGLFWASSETIDVKPFARCLDAVRGSGAAIIIT